MSTVQDVARLAGVSTATVSRVMNGYEHVSPAILEKVNTAIESLGYEPNHMAKSLRTLKTSRILVTVPDIANLFFSNIIRGAEEAASAAGYAVLLGDVGFDDKVQDNYASMLRRREADGLIFLGHSLPESLNREIERRGPLAPIVNGCEFGGDLKVSSVHIDNAAAAAEVMDYLYELGHKRIGVITGSLQGPISRDRLAGVRKSAQRHSLESDLRVETGDYSIDSGAELAASLLDVQPALTALFCFSDDMAAGALHAIRERGLSCPNDVSVVGFDDIKSSRYTSPPLTTVSQPMREIGKRTVEILIGIIEGRALEITNVTLEHKLIVRASTAAPRD